MNTSFIDLLFNLLLGFVVLFIISFMLIRPPTIPSLKPPVEMIITMEWSPDHDDDLDIWVQDPNGKKIWYKNKQAGFMSLDRDDLGNSSDQNDGFTLKINKEIVLIRGLVPGEYIVNVFGYRRTSPIPKTPVTIQVTKLTPFQIIDAIKLEVGTKEEITAIRFIIDKDGNLVSKSYEYHRLVTIESR